MGTVSDDGKAMSQFSGTMPGEMKLHGWDVSGEPIQNRSIPYAAKTERNNSYGSLFSSWQDSTFTMFHTDRTATELALDRTTATQPELTGAILLKGPETLYRAALSPDGRVLAPLRESPGDIVLENSSSSQEKQVVEFRSSARSA